MIGVFTTAHPSAGIHLSIVKVFTLAFSGDMVYGSVLCILAATVSDISSRQNIRVRIITNAETITHIYSCPLVFTLAYTRRIEISIWIGAEADAISSHLGMIGILATTNARR